MKCRPMSTLSFWLQSRTDHFFPHFFPFGFENNKQEEEDANGQLKLIYSEKATKFFEIFTLLCPCVCSVSQK